MGVRSAYLAPAREAYDRILLDRQSWRGPPYRDGRVRQVGGDRHEAEPRTRPWLVIGEAPLRSSPAGPVQAGAALDFA